MAREDEKEIEQLHAHCPKYNYSACKDLDYIYGLSDLLGLGIAVQSDMGMQALCATICSMKDKPVEALYFLQHYANHKAAWEAFLDEIGIEYQTMQDAIPTVPSIAVIEPKYLPEPEEDALEEMRLQYQTMVTRFRE